MRAPRRIGVDRAWIVIGCVIALVVLGLAKPWEHPSGPSAAVAQAPPSLDTSAKATLPAKTADSAATPQPTPAAPPAARPSPASNGLTLALATSQLSTFTAASNTGWLVAEWHPDPVEITLVPSLPSTAALGSTCSDGFMLHEGTNAIALALPTQSGTVSFGRVVLRRLFADGKPVPVPLNMETTASGIVLLKGDERGWDPGDYALTVGRRGQTRSFVFCVGRSYRMVDYSLITTVPPGVDSRGTRSAILQ